ncbi:unnamed protein product [Parnassius mnemosyne]|uniref:Uncharacterized protein n=1 Tax=Parnassius mnemosyne TaxID=213953 RepID=A0AAV1KTA9_9NEOP
MFAILVVFMRELRLLNSGWFILYSNLLARNLETIIQIIQISYGVIAEQEEFQIIAIHTNVNFNSLRINSVFDSQILFKRS